MWQVLKNIKYGYVVYSAIGINLALIWLTGIYLYIQGLQKQKKNLLYLVAVLIFLLLNPITANNIMTFVSQEEGYWMAFLIIPSAVFIAYGMTKLIITQREEKVQWGLMVGGVLILLVSTNFNFSLEGIGVINNQYKISQEAREIQQMTSAIGDLYIIAPREIGEELREYDVSVRVLGGDAEKWAVLEEISSNWTDLEKIAGKAAIYGCNCIVYPKTKAENVTMEKINFTMVGETENYFIYLYRY